jgi:hypothetical protein
METHALACWLMLHNGRASRCIHACASQVMHITVDQQCLLILVLKHDTVSICAKHSPRPLICVLELLHDLCRKSNMVCAGLLVGMPLLQHLFPQSTAVLRSPKRLAFHLSNMPDNHCVARGHPCLPLRSAQLLLRSAQLLPELCVFFLDPVPLKA